MFNSVNSSGVSASLNFVLISSVLILASDKLSYFSFALINSKTQQD
ncbi:hypothetical protein [Mycoplasmopsis canis]|nr:hypothetical protein [Mycoplasmopsis canis]